MPNDPKSLVRNLRYPYRFSGSDSPRL
ncbi:hypothetical protein LNO88_20545 [Klebsiella pneumoniae subsp. pneumoniae]|nr:hypothetical protein [Klebsiella pneumoniae subsp. pneumoniae]